MQHLSLLDVGPITVLGEPPPQLAHHAIHIGCAPDVRSITVSCPQSSQPSSQHSTPLTSARATNLRGVLASSRWHESGHGEDASPASGIPHFLLGTPMRIHPAPPGAGSLFAGGTKLGSPCLEVGVVAAQNRLKLHLRCRSQTVGGCIVRDQQLPCLFEIRLWARGRSWAECLAFGRHSFNTGLRGRDRPDRCQSIQDCFELFGALPACLNCDLRVAS